MGSLSKLPEDIVNHIFSYLHLDNKRAIQLGLLSTELHSILQKRPVLVFDHGNCYPEDSDSGYRNRYRQELEYFVSTLDRYQEENIRLQAVTLKANFHLPVEHLLFHRFIRLAIQKGITKLDMSFPVTSEKYYVIPQSVFEAESLVELSLQKCTLRPERGSVAWRNLKRLRLHYVKFGDDRVFEDIVKGTNSLLSIECLEIFLCRGSSNYKFPSAWNGESLKQLNIGLRNYSCYSQPLEWNLKCRNLKSLTLSGARLWDNIFLNFPHLQELCIRECRNKTLTVSSPSLKKIRLKDSPAVKEARFDVPNILHFEYAMYKPDLIPKLSFRGNSSGWVSCLEFSVSKESGFLKMKQFLAAVLLNSTASESSLTINWEGTEVLFLADDLSGRIIPAIRDLTVRAMMKSMFSLPHARSILISMFRICRPMSVSVSDLRDSGWPCTSSFRVDHMWNMTLPPYRQESQDDELLKILIDDEEMKKIKLEHWRSCPEMPPPAKRLKLN